MTPIRFRLYGRVPGQPPQAGVPLPISFETAFEQLSQLPRMFIEPDGSFLWTGPNAGDLNESSAKGSGAGQWQLEGTLFDDGSLLRRIELIGNCSVNGWQNFLIALRCDWDSVAIELLEPGNPIVGGEWLKTVVISK